MFTIIVNPTSGGRKANRVLPQIESILRNRNMVYTLIETPYPTEKEMLAHVPCSADDTVCIVGGDGTVLNILNCLPGHEMTLICVPCGTGNDFVKTLKLPPDPVEAFMKQLDGTRTPIDFAKAGSTYFINIFGTGFDVDVLKQLEAFKIKFTGLKAYLKALVQAIKFYKPVKCMVSVDGGEFAEKEVSTLMVGNGQYLGGGMRAVPDGDPFDGVFNVIEIAPVTKLQLIRFLPRFLKGSHVQMPITKCYTCKNIRLKADDLEYQLDGEIMSSKEVEIDILHGVLHYKL